MAFISKWGAIVVLMLAVIPVKSYAQGGGGGGEGNVDGRGYKAMASRFLTELKLTRDGSCSAHEGVCKDNDILGAVKSHCCKDRCINVLTNRDHCGSCGKYCSFGYACCNGKCVNVASDNNNCGECGVLCNKIEKCVYGMCSYS